MRGRLVGGAVASLLVVLAVGAVLPSPASAGGGSLLEPDREWYRSGDVVHLVANVRKLDRDWHGPYTVGLRSLAALELGPEIPVGRLVVTRLDDQTVRAEVTFVLPKLDDGNWLVTYCSPGCAHALGDLQGGSLWIGPPPEPLPPPTTVAPVPTTAVATATTAMPRDPTTTEDPSPIAAVADAGGPSDGALLVPTTGSAPSRLPLWWLLAGVVLVGTGAAAWRVRARGPRRVVTSTTAHPG
jgi:hypothetical protein